MEHLILKNKFIMVMVFKYDLKSFFNIFHIFLINMKKIEKKLYIYESEK